MQHFPHILDSLPHNLLISTLRKLPNIPLCRLRQTCSSLNNFIENYQKELAARPEVGLELLISCGSDDNRGGHDEIPGRLNFIHYKENRFTQRRLPFREDVKTEICQMLSAISISRIIICLDDRALFDEEKENTLLEILSRLRLSCDWAQIYGVSLPTLIELADLIDCRGKISFQMRHDDFSYDNFVIMTTELKKHRKHPNFKVSISVLTECRIDKLFDRLKPFRAAHIRNCTTDSFHEFLSEIAKSPGVGNLQKVTCEFWDTQLAEERFWPFRNPALEQPPFSVLWELALVPKHFQVIRCLNKPFEDDPVMHDWISPNVIHLVELPNNFAVIVFAQEGALFEEEIHFVEKDMVEVLKVVIHELRIGTAGEKFFDEYMAADEDRRQELLAAEFVYSVMRKEMRMDNF